MNTFFYGVLPYIALVILVGGTIVRYTMRERNWTTKSSQFLGRDGMKWAGPLFHLGLVMAFGGHVIGVLIPKFVTETAGINEHSYHMIALSGGIPAAVLFLGGFIVLSLRRFGKARMKVNTSNTDRLLYLVLFLTILSGTLGTVMNISGAFDYRESISPWFRSVLMLHPDVPLMDKIPAIFQIHMLMWMLTAILFPFSRLVHCLSVPFEYIGRAHILYRRK